MKKKKIYICQPLDDKSGSLRKRDVRAMKYGEGYLKHLLKRTENVEASFTSILSIDDTIDDENGTQDTTVFDAELAAIKKSDAVMMCPGWNKNDACRLALDTARKHHKDVYFYEQRNITFTEEDGTTRNINTKRITLKDVEAIKRHFRA